MREAATKEASAMASGREWTQDEAARDQRTVEDVVAAGVLLDVSRLLEGLLGLARPTLGTRTERVTRLVRQMTGALALDRPWEFEVAARLSQIGWLTVPAETHEAAWRGDPLLDEEWRAVASHPLVARDLLADVTRLDGVREMIARQREPFAVPGEASVPPASRDRLMLGGHILRVCGEYIALLDRGLASDAALEWLSSLPFEFDPTLVCVLARCVRDGRLPAVSS
jgi:hypothetical protein